MNHWRARALFWRGMGDLWGAYDERGNADSFKEAVASFRSSKPPAVTATRAAAAATSADCGDHGRRVAAAKTAAFEPAATFSGARPGRVFKSGAQGLGYYCAATAAAQTTAPRRCTHARTGLS